MTEEQKLNFALTQLDRLSGHYSRLESRITSFLAVNFGLFSVLILNLSKETLSSPFLLTVAAAAIIPIALSIYFTFEITRSHLQNPTRVSAIYFGDIAKGDAQNYIGNISSITTAELLNDALCQVWRNSQILSHKYSAAHNAFSLMLVGVSMWIVFLSAVFFTTGHLPLFAGK